MAKQRFGINDGYRGTVGTVIGYQWRGKWCLRAKPRFVHNPRTECQQLNRHLFKEVVAFSAALRQPLRVGFHDRALQLHMTEANLFLHLNKGRFALDDNGRLSVDYPSLAVSDGPVAPVGFLPPEDVAPTPNPSLQGGDARSGSNVGDARSGSNAGDTRSGDGISARANRPLPAGRGGRVADGVGVSISIPFERNPLHLRANNDDQVYLLAICPDLDDNRLSAPTYRR